MFTDAYFKLQSILIEIQEARGGLQNFRVGDFFVLTCCCLMLNVQTLRKRETN